MEPEASVSSWSAFIGGWEIFRNPLLCALVAGAVLGFLGVFVVLRRMVFVSAGCHESSRASRVTNRRWAVSALGAAATCALTTRDTVYCCLPLHHPTGLLVAVSSAVIGGARLAVATERPTALDGGAEAIARYAPGQAGHFLAQLRDALRREVDCLLGRRGGGGSGLARLALGLAAPRRP